MRYSQQWVIASNNQKKVNELRALLEPHAIAIQTMADFNVPSPPEDGLTFAENALIKARHVAKATGRPSLADDSGLVVPMLGGAPGLYSARYAFEGATDAENNEALIAALTERSVPFAQAYYHCTLVFLRHEHDPDPIIAQGRWHGRVYPELKGSQGFGYDPMFYPGPDYSLSAGQLDPGRKAELSHRGIAIGAFLQSLLVEEG